MSRYIKLLNLLLGTGLIALHLLGEQKPFISYVDPDPLKVNYVTISSVEPFIIKYNCPKLTSNLTLPISVEQTGKITRQNNVNSI